MPLGIGVEELIVILVIALVIFGPSRLPAVGRSLGETMREIRRSVDGKDVHSNEELPRNADGVKRGD
jgi:sec-independent protein translocase protein TatA